MQNASATIPQNELLIRAIRGEPTGRAPVWFMRQAGRSDPEYNRLKAEAGMALEDLFRHPEWAARLSLLPKRIGVDAIIFFQDILTPLAPMGAYFRFAPGPVLDKPIGAAADADRLALFDVGDELSFVPETFRLLKTELNGALPILGFAGAPLTLAVFLAEGRSFGREAPRMSAFMRSDPKALRRLLQKLTDMTIDYLKLQAEAGAAAVQLFESAAPLLTAEAYREFALPYQQQILDAMRDVAPTIVFSRDWTGLSDLSAAGADVISLPAAVSLEEARAQFGPDQPLQGNLDNRLLAHGEWEDIERAVAECLAAGQAQGHIFNLSHGLLRDTPFDRVRRVVEIVRDTRFPISASAS